jgi:hypothetical protein
LQRLGIAWFFLSKILRFVAVTLEGAIYWKHEPPLGTILGPRISTSINLLVTYLTSLLCCSLQLFNLADFTY